MSFKFNPFSSTFDIVGAGGGGIAIGDPVTGADDYSVLFIDASGNLAQNPDIIFDPAGSQFLVGNNSLAATLVSVGSFLHLDSDVNFNIVANDFGTIFNADYQTSLPVTINGSSGETLMLAYPFGNTITFGSTNILGGTVGIESVNTTSTSLVIKAITSQTANFVEWQASGGSTLALVAVNGNALFQSLEIEADLNHDGTAIGFFGTAPQTQQAGGAATASGTYGATEQGMLNAVYSMARTYGLLT